MQEQIPTPTPEATSLTTLNPVLSPPPPIPPSDPPKKSFPILAVVLFLLAGFAIALMYFATTLLQSTVNTNTSTKQTVSQKLVVGTDATFEPMEYKDENGNFLGYDIELGQRLAEQMGVEIEFRDIAWDNIFTALENKEIDMIISSVTITDERREKYNFSDQYINAGQVIVTRKTDDQIKTTADLQGKKIAVQKGTTNEQQALEFTTSDMVVTFDDFIGATEALITGDVDAIFSDLTGAKGIISQNQELKIASEPFTSDYYGIVLRKDQPELLANVNSALSSLRQQGFLVYLKQKWLD